MIVDLSKYQFVSTKLQKVNSIINLFLTGCIHVTVDIVQEVMVAADMLQLSDVVDICGDFLRAHMDPSNCVGVYRFLEQIGCMELLQFTEDYIHVHFLEVRLMLMFIPLCSCSSVSKA